MKASFALVSLTIISIICVFSLAQEIYVIQEATLTVYRDGVAHVKVIASVDEVEPLITLPLLSSSIHNVLVFDGEGEILDYDVDGQNITVYCLGATKVTLEYDTGALTSKEADLWTLTLNAPFEMRILLPENSTIIYLNASPSSISIEDGRIALSISPGFWEISYIIEAAPQPPPSSSPQRPLTEYMIIIGVAILCIAALIFVFMRRSRRLKVLRGEEVEVLRFLKEIGGRALEAELRERFPQIPRTSMWRLIKRLEKQGIVRVRRVGLQNLVELK